MFQEEINQLIEFANTSLLMAENLKAASNKASYVVDRLKPTGLDDCPYEEAMWHQENAKSRLECMMASDEDKDCDYKAVIASLSAIENIAQPKSHNPYVQAVFVSFDERHHHAYA